MRSVVPAEIRVLGRRVQVRVASGVSATRICPVSLSVPGFKPAVR